MATRKTFKVAATKMDELLGGNAFGNILRIFDLMEIAEEVIKEEKRKHPRDAANIDRAFLAACPSDGLRACGENLYRAHVREMCDRLRASINPDPRMPTKAEMLAAISAVSTKAPPRRDVTALYERLFADLFPAEVKRLAFDKIPGWKAETYPNAVLEIERELIRKLRVDDREFGDLRVVA